MAPCNENTARCPCVRRGKNLPSCCVEILRNLLFYTVDLFEKHHIDYWLDYGAFLGAVRKGELIPWDSDVDFGVMDTEVSKIGALKEQIFADGYDFRAHQLPGPRKATAADIVIPENAHHIYIFRSPVNTLSAEIRVWTPVIKENGEEDDLILTPRRKFYQGERAIGRNFSREYIQPLDEVEMYGRKFKCPRKSAVFLKFRYGDKWSTEIRG